MCCDLMLPYLNDDENEENPNLWYEEVHRIEEEKDRIRYLKIQGRIVLDVKFCAPARVCGVP